MQRPPSRRERIRAGAAALRDVTRLLRGEGAAQRSGGSEQQRGAMFDLAALADRLEGYAEDQSTDDWDDFWITAHEVTTLDGHVVALSVAPRGLSSGTLPALRSLHAILGELATRHN